MTTYETKFPADVRVTGTLRCDTGVTVPAPSADTDASTKLYVDATSSGLSVKDGVRAATTAALPAVTYDNGTAGVGATLTADANGALAAQDGITLLVTERLLVKDQASALQNGPYTVTQVGTGATPFVLTRATGSDTAAELDGAHVAVSEGSTQSLGSYTLVASGAITVGTTALDWVRFSGSIASGSIGAGLELSSGALTVAAQGVTASMILDATITAAKFTAGAVEADALAGAVAGFGLTGGAGSALAVGAGAGLTVTADDIGITAGGVGTAQLATNAVTTIKIIDAAVTGTKIASGVLDTGVQTLTSQTYGGLDLSSLTMTPFIVNEVTVAAGQVTMPTAVEGLTFTLLIGNKTSDAGEIAFDTTEFHNDDAPTSRTDGQVSIIQFVAVTADVGSGSALKWGVISERGVVGAV